MPEQPSFHRRLILLCLGLALVTFLAYLPLVRNGFVPCDDPQYLLENSHVGAGLTWSGAAWAFTSGYAANWHPMTWLSHMLDCSLFGLHPAGHHLVSLVLHLAVSLLLFIF